LAAKNADFVTGTVNDKSLETGAQDWNFSCGVCHVGGGQMEYDRNMGSYGTSTTPAGDNKYYSYLRGQIVDGYMDATNKAEVDCLMCHLSDGGTSGSGRAWLQSIGCNAGNQMGPLNDPTCSLGVNSDGSARLDGTYGLVGAGMFTPGTKYDPLNRNLAIRAQSLNYAASLGIGATVASWGAPLGGGADGNYKQIATITGVPLTISGANINATPRSQNCSACHARDDDTPGAPRMLSTVRLGYGNVYVDMPAGTAVEKNTAVADGNGKNKVGWIELGCKTGMGKRGQRIGIGPNDKWGMSMFNQMFGLGKHPGDPVVTEKLPVGNPMMQMMGITTVSTKERIPDYDVHDKSGMQCATCHYAIGSSKLTGVATNEGYILSSNGTVTIPAGANLHGLNTASGETGVFGVNYPAEQIYGIDHQFAQGDDLKDTYGKNNLDGTVSCESCHIERTHPKYFSAPNVAIAGVTPPPVPTHASFPAFHMEKIACSACHIPEVYIAPFRLKSRDWSTGFFKKGNETNGAFKNTYDWEYDLVTGAHAPIKPIYQWSAKYEKKKITPVLASEMPIWVKLNSGNVASKGSDTSSSVDNTSAIKTCSYGSRIFAQCNTSADCPGGLCVSGLTSYAAPAVTRDVMAAAISLDTSGILRRPKGNLNAASLVPLFDGWPLIDGIGVDTAARIDAMSTAGAGDLLKIFHANFDVTHGIVPKEWALGGSKRGGCVSCHSSAQPVSGYNADGSVIPNPNYSTNSVGFFEGSQHGIPQWAGTGNYDLMKNPFNLYVDWDATAYCGMGTCGGGSCATPDLYGQGAGKDAFGNPLTGDSYYFDPAGNPNLGLSCAPQAAAMGFSKIDDVVGFMQKNFDLTMGLPSGTAKLMGLNDGISALQGFTLRETVSATALGCNPFTGAASIATMMGFPVNVNNCMPANNPMFNAGTCVGATQTMPGGCDQNSFRSKGMCFADSDCNGVTWSAEEYAQNPNGLLYQRGEIRNQHKLQFQQGKHLGFESVVGPDGANQLWWPILTEQNPRNPNHKWAWDQSGAANVCGAFQNEPCCTNPMTNQPMSCGQCADAANSGAVVNQVSNACTGMLLPPNVRTAIHGNQLLGYDSATLTALMKPSTAGVITPSATFSWRADSLISKKVNFTAVDKANQTYSWDFGDGATAAGATTSHTFAGIAPTTVRLTVVDTANGQSATNALTIIPRYVGAASPISLGTPTITIVGFTGTFHDVSTGGIAPVTIKIAWGDGKVTTMAQGDTATHVYPRSKVEPYPYRALVYASDSGVTVNGIASRYRSNVRTDPKNPIRVVVKPLTIMGLVTKSSGTTVLPYARLTLMQGTKTVKRAMSDRNGLYTFTNVVPNIVSGATTSTTPYTVVPSKTGFTFSPAISSEFTIAPDSDTASVSGLDFTTTP
jgi:hypothetical protein